MDLWSILAWIVAILVLSISYWYLSVPKNLPPGSAGLPILGYLPYFNQQFHETFTKLGEKFGGIYHLYLGSQLVVVLNDFEAVKLALKVQGDIFAGRMHMTEFEDKKGVISGVIMTDGEFWKQHRRFIIRNLKDNGVGKLTIEPLIMSEIEQFVAEVRKNDGLGAFSFRDILMSSMMNNIQILVHGKRYDYGHPAIVKIKKLLKEFEDLSAVLPMEMLLPWLKPILSKFNTKRIAQLVDHRESVKFEMEAMIEDTVKSFKIGQSNDDNYVNAFLIERNNRMKSISNETIFTDEGLLYLVDDLLRAGTDTSATTLAWTALYLAKYPQIQKKVQEEIDLVIGQREPSYNDRINTPYTEATICEIHRIITLVPLSVPRRVVEDTTLYGYNIPRNTMVLTNIWAVHNDTKLWGDPQNFRPERFIGPNGDCLKPEHLMPFSMGKRACAGEPLARMELYLYLVTLMQHFTFYPPKGVEITFESPPGFVRHPTNGHVCVKSRSH